MNLKIKISMFVLLLCSFTLIAQNGFQLTGKVSDAAGMPIPGVNVIIANTSRGAATDFDGNFQIDVKQGVVHKPTKNPHKTQPHK